jgi:ElaB/YqjD/DUF883 family membrane-anchored ribosome-binding protein
MEPTNGHVDNEQMNEQLQTINREMTLRAKDVRKAVSSQLKNLAETIRREAPDSMRLEAVADTLDQTAQYINSKDLDRLNSTAKKAIRKDPWRAVGVAFIAGLIASMWLNRRR